MSVTKNAGRVGGAFDHSLLRLMAILASGAMLCSAAHAAGMGNKSDIDSAYQRERAACMNGSSNQDRKTCLKEAVAAREEARRGRLNVDITALQRNTVARCEALPESDRRDCMRRMDDDARVSGSVGAGGVLRESVTIVPAPPQPVAPIYAPMEIQQ